jgi:ribulose-phosphate 3-epimerase
MVFERIVSPSLLAADYGNLAEAAKKAQDAGAGSLHLDYMDGHYVPNISFGIDLIPALKRRVNIPLVAHLMISNTGERIADFMRVHPDYIVVQEDAVKRPERYIDTLRDNGIKPGLAINPSRPLKKVQAHLHRIDLLLIMSVNPGFGGQAFIPDTLEKMEEAHRYRVEHGLGYDIGVDGGVNLQTARSIVKTGANVLIAGTAVFGSEDLADAVEALRAVG